jgi:hypothetical protein
MAGFQCFVETFVQGSTFVLRMNFSAKNPALRQENVMRHALEETTHLKQPN